MTVKIHSTKDAATHGIKLLIYGQAGSGKTSLAATCPGNPIIISAEAGLLSLKAFDIPATTVQSLDDVRQVYTYLRDHKDGQIGRAHV